MSTVVEPYGDYEILQYTTHLMKPVIEESKHIISVLSTEEISTITNDIAWSLRYQSRPECIGRVHRALTELMKQQVMIKRKLIRKVLYDNLNDDLAYKIMKYVAPRPKTNKQFDSLDAAESIAKIMIDMPGIAIQLNSKEMRKFVHEDFIPDVISCLTRDQRKRMMAFHLHKLLIGPESITNCTTAELDRHDQQFVSHLYVSQ
jgi:hypothetical protein